MKKLAKKSTGGAAKKPAKKLIKAQTGTAFQSYLKNVPGAVASDTLGVNDPRRYDTGFPSSDTKKNALAAAFQKTYGNTHGKTWAGDPSEKESDYRKPQTKKTVKAYTKSASTAPAFNKYENIQFQKKGGATSKYKSGGQGPANKIGKMVKISKKK